MRPLSPILIVALAAAVPAPAAPDANRDAPGDSLARIRAVEQRRIEIIQRLAPSVVCVFPIGTRSGGGSGVIIDSEGYGLTNYHVVRGMAVSRRGDGGLPDGKRYPLEVLGLDPGGDVAMFKLEGDRPFYPAPLGDSDRLRLGDWTLAMGNPFLLAEDHQPTVTFGIVSGLHRYQPGEQGALIYSDCIQVDTSINPGNSGGPLFDLRGELVGINGRVSVEERGRVNVGVGYAIPINQIRRFMPALRAGLHPRHATLGATVRDAADGRVLVNQVRPDSAAHDAGLRTDDALLRIAGVEMRSAKHVLSLVDTYPAGWPVTLAYERDGQQMEIRLRLDEAPWPERLAARRPFFQRHPDRDPFRLNRRANTRAARRAISRYARAVGLSGADAAIARIQFEGNRTRTDRPGECASSLDTIEEPPPPDAADPADPDQLESVARWDLLAAAAGDESRRFSVVGGDEVAGRIAVVLRRRSNEPLPYRALLDDSTGDLLAIEFEHGDQRFRFEYDDVRLAGALRLPHQRRALIDGRPAFIDEFTRIHASTGP